jgi:choline kinase
MENIIRTAVIMAAGMGTRFGKMTESIPKGFIDVGGKSMIVRSIETLIDCGIDSIIIGTGYHYEKYEELQKNYPQTHCCFSERYASTNSLWTLCNCQEMIGSDDFLLLESDLVYEKKAIIKLLSNEHPNIMLASDVTKFQDQYYLEYDDKGFLTNCSIDKNDLSVCGELVGIHKISNSFFQALCSYYKPIKHSKPKLGYEYGILHLSQTTNPLFVLKIKGLIWYEIDDEQDLNYALEFCRILQ